MKLFRGWHDHLASRWPLLWKLRPDLFIGCLLLSILLAILLGSLLRVLLVFPTTVRDSMAITAVTISAIILGGTIYSWNRAIRQVPAIKSLPHEKYTPSFHIRFFASMSIAVAGLSMLQATIPLQIAFPGVNINAIWTSIAGFVYASLIVIASFEWHRPKDIIWSFVIFATLLILLTTLATNGAFRWMDNQNYIFIPLLTVSALTVAAHALLLQMLRAEVFSLSCKRITIACGYLIHIFAATLGIYFVLWSERAGNSIRSEGQAITLVLVCWSLAILGVRLLELANARLDSFPKRQ